MAEPIPCPNCKYPSGDPNYRQDLYKVLGFKIYQNRYFTAKVVQCLSCQKEWYVIETGDYHVPGYQWIDDKNHLTQLTGESVDDIIANS
jgi:hypothetical protein